MDRRSWAAFAAVAAAPCRWPAWPRPRVARSRRSRRRSPRTPIPARRSTWRGGRGCRTPEQTGRSAGRPSSFAWSPRTAAASTETMGRESPAGSGRYEATIAIPSGGVGRVEVGLFGESCVDGTCTRSDLLFELPEDQRVPQSAAARRLRPWRLGGPGRPRPSRRPARRPRTRWRTCRSPSRSSWPACSCWWWPSG